MPSFSSLTSSQLIFLWNHDMITQLDGWNILQIVKFLYENLKNWEWKFSQYEEEEEKELCLQGVKESQPIQHECASYELLWNAPTSVDQLAYWLAHKEQFPILSHLASQVNSMGLQRLEEITAPVLVHFPQ